MSRSERPFCFYLVYKSFGEGQGDFLQVNSSLKLMEGLFLARDPPAPNRLVVAPERAYYQFNHVHIPQSDLISWKLIASSDKPACVFFPPLHVPLV